MAISKKTVRVIQEIEVDLDETKFTPEFMAEFRESFYPFTTLDEHRCHLAQIFARGIGDGASFIEGYGPAKGMGISFRQIEQEEEII